MRLHFIRHGETDWNAEGRIQGWSDSVLNDNGRSQARQRRTALAAFDIGAVWCSSSLRARQTAAILVTPGTPMHYDPALREMGLGPWEGQLWRDIRARYPEITAHFDTDREKFFLKGAETFASTQRRGVRAIEGIVAASTAEHVLIVSHGAIIKTILAYYAGLPIRLLSAVPGLGNCSHSEIVADRSGARRVVRVDDQAFGDSAWAGLVVNEAPRSARR